MAKRAEHLTLIEVNKIEDAVVRMLQTNMGLQANLPVRRTQTGERLLVLSDVATPAGPLRDSC